MKKTKAKLWKCPRCKRYFPSKQNNHSCVSFPVTSHFTGKTPAVKRLFESLRRRVTSLGRVKVGSVRTEIFFQNRFHFAACQVRARHLVLFFAVPRLLKSPRFKTHIQVGRGKFLYTARIASPGDVDGELVGLLREAHHNAG